MLALGLATISRANVIRFNSAPVLGATEASGVWYTDRAAPAGFAQAYFDGGNRLEISISSADYNADTFDDYQGRKYDFNDPVSGTAMVGSLYVDSSWQTPVINVGMWGTVYDSSNSSLLYPIIAFRNVGSDPAGFYGWDYNNGGWFLVDAVPSYDAWYNLKMEFSSNGLNYYVNNSLVYTFLDPNVASYQTIDNIILNSYNDGNSYNAYWDNVGTSAVPEPSSLLLLVVAMAGLAGIKVLRRRFTTA